jgi:hypothetical protein
VFTAEQDYCFKNRRQLVEQREGALQAWRRWPGELNGLVLNGSAPDHKIMCSDEAESAHDALFEQYEARVRTARVTGSDDMAIAYLKRSMNTAYVVAGLYAALDGRLVVDGADMRRATKLVSYGFRNAVAAADQLRASDTDKIAFKIMRVLTRLGESGATRKEILQYANITKTELDAVLPDLVEREALLYQRTGINRARMWEYSKAPAHLLSDSKNNKTN